MYLWGDLETAQDPVGPILDDRGATGAVRNGFNSADDNRRFLRPLPESSTLLDLEGLHPSTVAMESNLPTERYPSSEIASNLLAMASTPARGECIYYSYRNRSTQEHHEFLLR